MDKFCSESRTLGVIFRHSTRCRIGRYLYRGIGTSLGLSCPKPEADEKRCKEACILDEIQGETDVTTHREFLRFRLRL